MRNFLRFLLLRFAMMLPVSSSFAQVSISPDNTGPDPSAMLDVKSSAMGVLIPRMTHAQLAAIPDPAEGLMVFCTDFGSGSLSIFTDGEWKAFSMNCMSPAAPTAAANLATRTQITWNWNVVPYSTGYRWSAVNDFNAATEMGTVTTITESGFSGGISYTRYVWAYNSCGGSVATTLVQSTEPPIPPTVVTSPVTSVGLTTASSGGNITDDGAAPVTERGVCWSTSPNPLSTGDHTTDGAGSGTFSSNLTGLSEGELYYVRAYATNSAGTAYGNEVSFTTSISDIDGNIYKTVKIGSQIWMAQDMKTTKLNDGTLIPNGFSYTGPSYLWYNNNIANKDPYGALYNILAVNSNKLAPAGWHVASDAEWEELVAYLGGRPAAIVKIKEAGTEHWQSPNTGATNESGFTALPGGFYQSGSFIYLGEWAHWWTAPNARYISVDYLSTALGNGGFPGSYYAFSVRCIKD
ncbi:MAG: FISUMP domain-containing protein [Bacteroidales bacterium]